MPEPNTQASWAASVPNSAGKLTADGRRLYRLVTSLVIWWAWAAVVVLSLGDLAIQGHDLSALRFAFGLLTVTGLVYACTLWPRVVAGADGITVRNPFRNFHIPWGAVKGVFVADSVQVLCARTPPKKDKTVYSWALSSPRRTSARAEMRARQWDRSSSASTRAAGLGSWPMSRGTARGRPAGWDRMPESAKEIAKMTHSDLIARELASIAREAQSESGAEAVSGDSPPTAVMSSGWAWQPLVALLVPALAFTIAMLVG